MKNKDKKEIIDFLLKTPRGRGIMFFAAYFIFFVALILLIRFGARGDVLGTDYESGDPYSFSLMSIVDNNYNYNYTVDIDGNSVSYTGSRYDDKELFSTSGLNYFKNSNNYLVNNNGVWIKSENPIIYGEFFDIYNISDLLAAGTLNAKTVYDSGKSTYNVLVSSASITKLLEKTDTDVEEVPNEITLSTDVNNAVDTIVLDLNSYCKVKGICTNSMKITLNYSDFGSVKEISSPLE